MIMQSRNVNNQTDSHHDTLCYDIECRYHGREHKHVRTNDGEYIKYIVPKPQYSHEI